MMVETRRNVLMVFQTGIPRQHLVFFSAPKNCKVNVMVVGEKEQVLLRKKQRVAMGDNWFYIKLRRRKAPHMLRVLGPDIMEEVEFS